MGDSEGHSDGPLGLPESIILVAPTRVTHPSHPSESPIRLCHPSESSIRVVHSHIGVVFCVVIGYPSRPSELLTPFSESVSAAVT